MSNKSTADEQNKASKGANSSHSSVSGSSTPLVAPKRTISLRRSSSLSNTKFVVAEEGRLPGKAGSMIEEPKTTSAGILWENISELFMLILTEIANTILAVTLSSFQKKNVNFGPVFGYLLELEFFF